MHAALWPKGATHRYVLVRQHIRQSGVVRQNGRMPPVVYLSAEYATHSAHIQVESVLMPIQLCSAIMIMPCQTKPRALVSDGKIFAPMLASSTNGMRATDAGSRQAIITWKVVDNS